MRYAVYGIEPFRTYAGNSVTSSSPKDVQLLYIDNDPSAHPNEDPAVMDIDTFEKRWKGRVDAVLVCAKDYKVRQKMVKTLLRTGFREIYIVDNYALSGKLPLFRDDGSFCSYVRNLRDVKPVLSYIEFHVTDFCNLKCKNCGHRANEVKELSFASLDVFEEALYGLADKFESIDVFRLLGGEPLLAPNIHKYADLVLHYFPLCKVKIVTNGLLVPKMSRTVLDYLRAHPNVEIQITQYPPTRKHAEEIVTFCRNQKIRMSLSDPVSTFFDFGSRSALENKQDSMEEQWRRCYQKDCHFLYEHRLFYCVKCWVEARFFGRDMTNASIDITADNLNGWDILSAIEQPFSVCGYCRFPYPVEKWSSANADMF